MSWAGLFGKSAKGRCTETSAGGDGCGLEKSEFLA